MKKKKYYYIFKEEQLDRMNVEYNKNDENTDIIEEENINFVSQMKK